MGRLFLSFKGRIGRSTWWLVIGATICLNLTLVFQARWWDDWTLSAAFAPLVAAMQIAPGVQRLHDMNKNGWWLLPYYGIPAALIAVIVRSANDNVLFVSASLALSLTVFWLIFELGFVRGSTGNNRYGPDPKLWE